MYEEYLIKMNSIAQIGGLSKYQKHHPLRSHLSEIQNQLAYKVAPQGPQLPPYPPSPEKIIEINMKIIGSISAFAHDMAYWLNTDYFNELLSDPELRTFISTRLTKPELFPAVIAELQQWGYLRARNTSPRLVQQDGLPDLKFHDNNSGNDLYFEVKTITLGSSPNSVERHIKKANTQIKRVSENALGGCFLWFPAIIVGGYKNNEVPEPLKPYVEKLVRVLNSERCRSVAKVIITWSEIACIGNIPGWQTWVITRKSKLIEHSRPRCYFDLNEEYFFKSTCSINIHLGNQDDFPDVDIRTDHGDIKLISR